MDVDVDVDVDELSRDARGRAGGRAGVGARPAAGGGGGGGAGQARGQPIKEVGMLVPNPMCVLLNDPCTCLHALREHPNDSLLCFFVLRGLETGLQRVCWLHVRPARLCALVTLSGLGVCPRRSRRPVAATTVSPKERYLQIGWQ